MAPGRQVAGVGKGDDLGLRHLQELGDLRGVKDLGRLGGPEGVAPHDEAVLAGLDHDAAQRRQAPGESGST